MLFASMSKWKAGIVNVALKLVLGKSVGNVMFFCVAGLKSAVNRVPLRRTVSSLAFMTKMLLMVMLLPTWVYVEVPLLSVLTHCSALPF